MANELTLGGSLAYEDSEGSEVSLDFDDIQATVSTKKYIRHKMSVGTAEEAIPLGEVTSLGWAVFKNLDETNFLEVRSGSGAGNDILKVPAGKAIGPFHFGSDITAPYAIANTAACQMEYMIVST